MRGPHEFTARELRIVLYASGLAAMLVMLLASINAAPASTIARDRVAVDSPEPSRGPEPSRQGNATAIVVSAQPYADPTTAPMAQETTKPGTTATTSTPAKVTHGTAVKEVAEDHTRVGGTHRSHGGAVSTVGRGTHNGTAGHRKSSGASHTTRRPADR